MEDVRALNQYSCITNLPDNLLDLIYGKVNEQDDQQSFGLTCHSFLKVQNLGKKHLHVRNYRSVRDSRMLDKLLSGFSKLQDLSFSIILSYQESVSDTDIIKLQKCGSTLQRFSLTNCGQVTDKGFISIASYCPLLSVICLVGCSITDDGLGLMAKSCKSLVEVNLSHCNNITLCGIQYLSQNCRQLKVLKVKIVSYFQNIGVGFVSVASYCPLLSVICLVGCSITDSELEILAKSCKFLIEVNLNTCINVSDCGIQYISQNCRQLRALKIRNCKNVVGVGFRWCSSNLKILYASCCALDSTDVIEILRGGGLEYLSFSWPVNERMFIGSIDLANLKVLDLEGCKSIEDDAIVSISKGCPLLRDWDLSWCGRVGLRGWESIGLYSQNLEIIHVYRCARLCNKGLLCLGNGCKRLSVIWMGSGGTEITSNGITAFKLQRDDVNINDKFGTGIIFPSWRFTWPFKELQLAQEVEHFI
ncbi:F-box/LRR-repeat protein 12-like [Rutidosis leptorrhynchoides]|uniref:F-box/LRR-repeat protein 12-like n=1 Tax=Rutidosis leptorrhynchoides TaxID=125765 RepID=UPI003A9A4299